MNKFIYTISLIFIFYTHLIYGFEFSAMTLNAQNLFDTTDDLKKDDKAYLPIELKQSKKLTIIKFLNFQSFDLFCLENLYQFLLSS